MFRAFLEDEGHLRIQSLTQTFSFFFNNTAENTAATQIQENNYIF